MSADWLFAWSSAELADDARRRNMLWVSLPKIGFGYLIALFGRIM